MPLSAAIFFASGEALIRSSSLDETDDTTSAATVSTIASAGFASVGVEAAATGFPCNKDLKSIQSQQANFEQQQAATQQQNEQASSTTYTMT
jgi:hypothetical protein